MTLTFTIEDSIQRGQEWKKLGRPFITSRQPKPSKSKNHHLYKARWYQPIPPLGQPLWDAYDGDRRRYFLAYQSNDEDIKHFQEAGMKAFVKMERKLLGISHGTLLDRYRNSGIRILKDLSVDLGNGETEKLSNVAFVAIDFEGAEHAQGVSEIGIALLEGHQIPYHETGFVCYNFRLKHNRSRKFMFGNTTSLSSEIIARTMSGIFEELACLDHNRKIVLVAHSAHNEARNMEDLGFSIDGLPIAGIADTAQLATKVLGCQTSSLECLLRTLSIPTRFGLLHCAGNDAHYTLQVMLALMQIQSPGIAYQLESLTRPKPPPLPSSRGPNEVSEDWADVMEVAGSLLEE